MDYSIQKYKYKYLRNINISASVINESKCLIEPEIMWAIPTKIHNQWRTGITKTSNDIRSAFINSITAYFLCIRKSTFENITKFSRLSTFLIQTLTLYSETCCTDVQIYFTYIFILKRVEVKEKTNDIIYINIGWQMIEPRNIYFS